MSYRDTFNKIKSLEPRERGNEFERLINKIFEDKGMLLASRFRTSDTQQEIDGAIQVFNKIFLIEAKWENSETLAASKLFSFIGKINSKINGTLGLFISYNELKENFIDAVRNGIQQNCILIHGSENILNIIDEKLDIVEYCEYCFIQASTRNRVDIPTSEFISLPAGSKFKKLTSITSDSWLIIYNSLIGIDTLSHFSALLEEHYSTKTNISRKILNIYDTIGFNPLVRLKFEKLVDKLMTEEENMFISEVIEKYTSDKWRILSDEKFTELIRKHSTKFQRKDREKIINNVSGVLNGGEWEDENKASNIIEIFYKELTNEELLKLAEKYFDIYNDAYKLDKFQQKKTANKLFKDIKSLPGYYPFLKKMLVEKLKIENIQTEMFREDEDLEEHLKRITVERVIDKNIKAIKDGGHPLGEIKTFVESEFDKL